MEDRLSRYQWWSYYGTEICSALMVSAMIWIIMFRYLLILSYSSFYQSGCLILYAINIYTCCGDIIWIHYNYFAEDHFPMESCLVLCNLQEVLMSLIALGIPIGPLLRLYTSLHPILLVMCGVIYMLCSNERKLPKTKIFGQEPIKGTVCPICLVEYEPNVQYYQLSCGHHAHVHCFRAWWDRRDGYIICYYNFCNKIF